MWINSRYHFIIHSKTKSGALGNNRVRRWQTKYTSHEST